MKTIKLFLLVTLLIVTVSTKAQVSINVNIGTPPVWAPRAPVQVEYYYLPDIEVYYDVPARRYIYLRNGNWFRSASLPARYRGYDLYHGQTIYLSDYHGRRPYEFYDKHRIKYKGNGNWKFNDHDNGNHKNQNYENENGYGNKHRNENENKNGKGHGHKQK